MKETGKQIYIDKCIKLLHYIYKGDYLEQKKMQLITRNRLAHLYKDKNKITSNIDYDVIYVADKYYTFGGLADRLRGIISLFDFCITNNLRFGIYFDYPFKLNKYLIPNKIKWEVDTLNRNPKFTYPLLIDTPSTLTNVFQYQKKQLNKIIQRKEKRQVHCYTNADLVLSPERFSYLFNLLFKPSATLKKHIEDNIRSIGCEYISISFRFVQLLGDFEDCLKQTLPVEEQNILIKKCIDAIYKIHSIENKKRILITADSQKFLNQIKNIEFVYIIPGTIGHLNYSMDENTHLKTFIDFMMISSAQKVYLARTNKMFKSGFARKAAMLSNIPFEEYIIDENG